LKKKKCLRSGIEKDAKRGPLLKECDPFRQKHEKRTFRSDTVSKRHKRGGAETTLGKKTWKEQKKNIRKVKQKKTFGKRKGKGCILYTNSENRRGKTTKIKKSRGAPD